MKRAFILSLSLFVIFGCIFGLRSSAQTHKPAKKKPTAQKPATRKPKPATEQTTEQTQPADANTQAAQPTASATPTPTPNETQPASEVKPASDVPAASEPKPTGAAKPVAPKSRRTTNSKQTAAQAEFEAMLTLPTAERVARLQAFIDKNPPAALKTRALEHLVSAHAALADEKLQAGDVAGGVDEFKQAVALAPTDMSDKLFVEVVAQFPANLFLRQQPDAAFEVARLIEAKVKDNPQRLLVLSAFYLNIEQVDEAARLAEAARTLAPDLAAAHQALGAARRLALRVDEAASEYKRALELDPKSVLSRRTLADLLRAQGKPEEALALYREQLTNDPTDRAAQTGVVLSLLDAGKREEAERELEAALKNEPRNLPLLVGAAYWFAAHNDPARALDLAGQAVEIEPRYTWAQVTLARALVAQKRAFEAERALRFAREYGRFPTLDYELANALAAAGLYEEAAEELAHTFTLKDGQLETRLAGRVPASAQSFTELLAPERRASLFQAAPADTDANAHMLKSLLAFYLALNAKDASADEATLSAAAKEFTAGDDDLRAFRQLYAADRLARRGLALNTAAELAEAAKSGVDAATASPVASVAIAADELRLIRARAINAGGTPDFPVVPREALTKIMRGRTEELIGWALFNQGKTSEAVTALRRAVSVLPDGSLYWRNAEWRLGAALAADGQQKDALAAYLKSYDPETPDPVRRAIIESLYTKVNGSLKGLDALIGSAPAQVGSASADASTTPTVSDAPTPTVEAATPTKTDEKAAPTTAEPPADASKPTPSPTSTPAQPTATPLLTSTPTSTPTPTPAPTLTPTSTSTPTPAPSPVEQTQTPASADSTPPPVATPTPAPEAAATVTDKPAAPNTSAPNSTEPKASEPKPTEARADETKAAEPKQSGQERAPAPSNEKPAGAEENKSGARPRVHSRRAVSDECALTLSVGSMLLTSNGGSSAVVASLAGQGSSADITATTADWADIIILREPQDPAPNAARYTVTSISKKTGTFVVTFKSPCGTKEITVTVK